MRFSSRRSRRTRTTSRATIPATIAALAWAIGLAFAVEPASAAPPVTTPPASLQGWGTNVQGQLGDGTTDTRLSPSRLADIGPWTLVDAGGYHSCGLKSDGSLWCWGSGSSGQLGDGGSGSRVEPVRVGRDTGWAQVATGYDHTCAVRTDGTLWCWGSNSAGQLGDGTATNHATPVQVGSGTTWSQVATGNSFSCSVRTDGTLWCWGTNYVGQLGDGTTTNRPTPTRVGNLSTWAQVDASGFGYHACATRTDGTLWCWGGNHNGAIGDGSLAIRTDPVQEATASTAWDRVATGAWHTCAVRTNGTLWCWGANADGQVGDGSTSDALSPQWISQIDTNWSQVSAGGNRSCAVKTDGHLACWGAAPLGDGTTSPRTFPADLGNTVWLRVSVGDAHTMAVNAALAQRIAFAPLPDRVMGDLPFDLSATTTSGQPVDFMADTPWTCSINLIVVPGSRRNEVTLRAPGVCTIRAFAPNIFPYDLAPDVVRSFTIFATRPLNGELTPLTPARILDTRVGTGGFATPVGPQQAIEVQVAGVGGVPTTGAAAVVMNVTVTEPTAATYVTIWPAGIQRPPNSNLNVTAGQTVPNLVTVALGAGGKVLAFNFAGSTHVIFDVVGFYAAWPGPSGSRFHAVDPFRLFDTRVGSVGVAAAPVQAGGQLSLDVRGHGSVPAIGVTAIVMNVTVTEPTAPSYLTVFPGDVARPTASNLNFVAGQTVPNLVTVRVPADGVLTFYNFAGTTHVIADVVGYYDDQRVGDTGRFVAVTPARLLDTRPVYGPLGPGEYGVLTVVAHGGVPLTGAMAVVLNVTVTETTAPSFLTVFPDDACDIPLASNLNYVAGQTVPNHVIVRLSTNGECGEGPGRVDFYNHAGDAQLIVDVFGYFMA